MGDKVKFNIHNVHYAIISETDGVVTYGKPVHIPGAKSFSLEPQGDVSPFYADGIVYYRSAANNGYQGDLEMALFPASFLKDVFGITEGTTSKVLTENAKAEPKSFALLFEEDGDMTGTKFVLYNCAATRPSRSFATIEETKDPTTSTITVTATSIEDGKVLAMTQEETPEETLSNWYKTVFVEGAGG